MGGQHGHGPEHHDHCHHSHRHDQPADGQTGSAFRWSIVLNSGLTALQLAISLGFGSLARIGDALHNLGNVVLEIAGLPPIPIHQPDHVALVDHQAAVHPTSRCRL